MPCPSVVLWEDAPPNHGAGSGPRLSQETMTMRLYDRQHRFYCGIDLHARTLSLHILDQAGQVGTGNLERVNLERIRPLFLA